MSTIELSVASRDKTGKGVARKLRSAGVVPAVIYRGGETPTMISINPSALTLAFERSGNPNNLVKLDVDGQPFTCLVREVQRHPVTGVIRHVDFYEVKEDETLTVDVPVKMVGKAAGVAMGGALRLIRRELKVRCLPGNIPSVIEADVTPLEIGKFLKVNQIPNPEGVEILFDDKGIFNIATVIKRRGSK
jgi:large subunit ribosomal protein L25